jgi:hypothetical protein
LRFYPEANANGVVLAGAEEFIVVQGLALGLFKAMEVTAFLAANRGLTAPGDDGFGQPRNALPFAGFARRLRAPERAFTFNGSHIASWGDLVRAAFGVRSTGAARHFYLVRKAKLAEF